MKSKFKEAFRSVDFRIGMENELSVRKKERNMRKKRYFTNLIFE